MKTILTICFVAGIYLCQGFGYTNREEDPLMGEANTTEQTKSAHFFANESISENCGDVLDTPTGGINYKIFGAIDKNERCIWVIRGGRAMEFSLDVLYVRNDSDAQIQVTCLRYAYTSLREQLLINQTGPVLEINECNVVIITFSTGIDVPTSATGFALRYSTVQGGYNADYSHDHILKSSNSLVVSYPASQPPNVTTTVLTTFTFISSNDNGEYNPSRKMTVNYIANWDETQCSDTTWPVFYVHYFNSTIQRWTYTSNFHLCTKVEEKLVENYDTILIYLHAGPRGQFNGFNLVATTTVEDNCTF